MVSLNDRNETKQKSNVKSATIFQVLQNSFHFQRPVWVRSRKLVTSGWACRDFYFFERRYYFPSTPSHFTGGGGGRRGWKKKKRKKNPRCGGGSTSRNKQEATRLSGPPAAADCHVASEDQRGSGSVVSCRVASCRPPPRPPTHTLFIHDNELPNGASGGGTANFEPCVRPVPPLTARHRRVSQGKQASAPLSPRVATRQTPLANVTVLSWGRFS